MIKNACLIVIILITFCLTYPIRVYSQYSDTTTLQKDRPRFKTFLPGIVAVSYGAVGMLNGPIKNLDLEIAERRKERRPNFHTNADDYFRYVPFIAYYGYELLGIHGKHDIKEKTSLLLISAVFSVRTTNFLKTIVNKKRPNDFDHKSFPSGHSALAFTGAELINQEYGDLSPWYSIASYSVASATSVLRIYNNDHWFSDVVSGAGIGILSTKLAYIIYPQLKGLIATRKNQVDFSIVPSYQSRVVGISISGKF